MVTSCCKVKSSKVSLGTFPWSPLLDFRPCASPPPTAAPTPGTFAAASDGPDDRSERCSPNRSLRGACSPRFAFQLVLGRSRSTVCSFTTGRSDGYRGTLVRRQLTLGLISSLPGRPDRRPLSFFRQATLSWTLPRDVLCVELATTGRLFRGRPSNLAHGLGAASRF